MKRKIRRRERRESKEEGFKGYWERTEKINIKKMKIYREKKRLYTEWVGNKERGTTRI